MLWISESGYQKEYQITSFQQVIKEGENSEKGKKYFFPTKKLHFPSKEQTPSFFAKSLSTTEGLPVDVNR